MTYNLNDQKQYMEALDFIEIARQNKWYVTLEKKRESRTNQQNKYYWLVLKYFALQYGCTKNFQISHLRRSRCIRWIGKNTGRGEQHGSKTTGRPAAALHAGTAPKRSRYAGGKAPPSAFEP